MWTIWMERAECKEDLVYEKTSRFFDCQGPGGGGKGGVQRTGRGVYFSIIFPFGSGFY